MPSKFFKAMGRREAKSKLGLVGLALLLGLMPGLVSAAELGEPVFNNIQFENRWVEQDRLVGKAGVQRFYTWGPAVVDAAPIFSESYKESPDGVRLVQYFDKGRMEINQPFSGNGTVTTGLLVRDLVSGQRQDGDNTFLTLPPSQTQVAGDDVSVNPDAPVYASFKNVITFGTPDANSASNMVGSTVNQFIDKSGSVSAFTPPEQLTIGAYQAETGHNIAKVFEDFKNQRGPVTNPLTGARLENQPVYTPNPTVNVFGYAVTEPYWLNTKVAGQARTVLVQLFQRRVLTYNPALPAGQRVEMGNLGQHYYKWRYVENASTAFPPVNIPASGCLPGATTGGNLVQACVNPTAPAKNTDVTLYGRLVVGGKVISGVAMTAKVGLFKSPIDCSSSKTGADGIASCTFNIGSENNGETVDILVNFNYNNQIYQTTVDFTPQ